MAPSTRYGVHTVMVWGRITWGQGSGVAGEAREDSAGDSNAREWESIVAKSKSCARSTIVIKRYNTAK